MSEVKGCEHHYQLVNREPMKLRYKTVNLHPPAGLLALRGAVRRAYLYAAAKRRGFDLEVHKNGRRLYAWFEKAKK